MSRFVLQGEWVSEEDVRRAASRAFQVRVMASSEKRPGHLPDKGYEGIEKRHPAWKVPYFWRQNPWDFMRMMADVQIRPTESRD